MERIKKEFNNLRHKLPDTGVPKLPESVGAFTFDHTSQRVYRQGVDLLLKPQEYRIFQLLAGNPGVYFASQELYSKTSGMDTNEDTRSLYVHISNLRKKLALDDAGNERSIDIEQQRGKGYRLVIYK